MFSFVTNSDSIICSLICCTYSFCKSWLRYCGMGALGLVIYWWKQLCPVFRSMKFQLLSFGLSYGILLALYLFLSLRPWCCCRYEYLDRFIRRRFQPNTFKFVASKVAADDFLFGPLDLLLFFSYVGLGQGRSVEQVKEDVKRDFIPALVLGGMIWPAVQIANFRFIPVRYQLLYVNLFCLLDSCFLSWIEQQGDASWKQWFTSFHKIEDQKSKVWFY